MILLQLKIAIFLTALNISLSINELQASLFNYDKKISYKFQNTFFWGILNVSGM